MSAPLLSDSALGAIGSTPLVRLNNIVPQGSADVLVKLEYFNPTASYKDRMARAFIEEAEKRGDLRPGMTVVEYTGGSTGSSLAFVCAAKGYAFKVVSSDAFSEEKLRTMRAFGADLTIVPSDGGKITPELFPRMMDEVNKIMAGGNAYFTDQFNNPDVLKGYAPLGHELLEQVGTIDTFCAAVGTAGMFMGVATVLRQASPQTRLIVLEPAESPILTQGKSGAHRIEGIGTGRVPPHLNCDYYHEARTIEESAARHMARRLAKEEGIFAGTSSGLNVAAAVGIAQELGSGHTVVTVAIDSGLKYLAGDLYMG